MQIGRNKKTLRKKINRFERYDQQISPGVEDKKLVKMNSDRSSVSDTQGNVRMSGFLEKKGKMKFMSQWKKYWFILEERLLLYYRSETEYTNLSPCRGSLNMGLVTTVHPGLSSGNCIIHIITRTQVIQLRAKNRATQEKWLQALLHSMSLPLLPFKTMKPPVRKTFLTGYGSSLNNIAPQNSFRPGKFDNDWTLPRKQDHSKRRLQIGGIVYGGSLDTAIWSKRFQSVRTSSPNISKGKFLEKILGFVKENDSLRAVEMRSRNSKFVVLSEAKEMKYTGEDMVVDDLGENKVKCKVHDKNCNHDIYSSIKREKKKINRTLSDSELNNLDVPDCHLSLENVSTERKDGSTFERIKNALSRIPRENILKGKPISEKGNRPPKKRRQSFLQKILKKKENEIHDCGADINDPLYDTIEHLQEQNRSSMPALFRKDDNLGPEKENLQQSTADMESLYAEVQKPVVGSKMILSATTMSELKLKLKSREDLEVENRSEKTAPSLPPRRVSRPISPWHDVPTNNAPVGSDAKSFFVHQAVVKFNDSVPPIEVPKGESDFSDSENEIGTVLVKRRRESPESLVQEKKNNDLSALLEQLTKITGAPLAEPELTDDNYNSSSESEKFWSKSQLSEPDYDIPRSHRPLSIVIFEEKEIISSTEFMGKCDIHSDTGSSLKSMEPDSLEMAEINLNPVF